MQGLRALIQRVVWRLRAQTAVSVGVRIGLLGAALGLLAIAGQRAVPALPFEHLTVVHVLAGALCCGLLGALWGALRSVSPHRAARLVDRTAGLPDTMASALEFAARPSSRRTLFEQAAIDHADQLALRLRASHIVPTRQPRLGRPLVTLSAMAATAFVGSVFMQERSPQELTPSRGEESAVTVLYADDVAAFRTLLRSEHGSGVDAAEDSEEHAQLIALLEGLDTRQIDRLDALRRIGALEQRLSREEPTAKSAALRAALRGVGDSLSGHPWHRDAVEALRNGDAAAAADALQALAERVRASGSAEAFPRGLSASLKKAARPDPQLDRLRQRVEARRNLLERASAQDARGRRRLLHKQRRQLEELERQHQEIHEGERQLERLRRELDEAGEQLGQDSPQAAQALDRGAEELRRLAGEQRRAQERQRLSEQLVQLKELIRRQRTRHARGKSSSQPGLTQPLDSQAFARLARKGAPSETHSGVEEASSSTSRNAGDPRDAHVPASADAQGPTRSEIILSASQRGFATRDYQRVHGEYAQHAERSLQHDEIPPGYRFYVRRYFQLIRHREEP